jgi:hypothetical protein
VEKKINSPIHEEHYGDNVFPLKSREKPVQQEELMEVLACGLCGGNTFHLICSDSDDAGHIACSSCGFTVSRTWKTKQDN